MTTNLATVLFAVSLLLLLQATCQQVFTAEPHDVQEKQAAQVKRRLSPHSAAQIQSCLVSSGDVGCGTFQCFSNNSCEIQGLHHICLTLLHNAGRYDSQKGLFAFEGATYTRKFNENWGQLVSFTKKQQQQSKSWAKNCRGGKSSVKEALRCMAQGLRQRFSCVSRRCSAVKEMVLALQRECYSKHQLCLPLRDHMDTMGNLIHFHLMFPPGPYVELVNFLLNCGDDVKLWVGRRLRGQCELQWGALCRTFGSTCPLGNQSDNLLITAAATPAATTTPTAAPRPITAQVRSQRQPTTAAEAEDRRNAQEVTGATAAAATSSGLPAVEKANVTVGKRK